MSEERGSVSVQLTLGTRRKDLFEKYTANRVYELRPSFLGAFQRNDKLNNVVNVRVLLTFRRHEAAGL